MKDLYQYLTQTINEADEAFVQELHDVFDQAVINILDELIKFVDKKSGNIQWSGDWVVKNKPGEALWSPWDKDAKEFFKDIFKSLKDSVGKVTRSDAFSSKQATRPWRISWGGQYAIMHMSEFNKLWKQYIKSQGKLGNDIAKINNVASKYDGGDHIPSLVSGVIDRIISEYGGNAYGYNIRSLQVSTGIIDAFVGITDGNIGRGVEGFICNVRDIKYRPITR